MLPVILVDEISVIDERSPVLGDSSFDTTARKRAFAYMLSGKDDTGIVTAERKDIANARRNAQLGMISDLLSPIEERLQKQSAQDPEQSIDKKSKKRSPHFPNLFLTIRKNGDHWRQDAARQSRINVKPTHRSSRSMNFSHNISC
jgi:hypothetical protein